MHLLKQGGETFSDFFFEAGLSESAGEEGAHSDECSARGKHGAMGISRGEEEIVGED
jgi:hypothetical protein